MIPWASLVTDSGYVSQDIVTVMLLSLDLFMKQFIFILCLSYLVGRNSDRKLQTLTCEM